jgi:hypothetical protein
MDLKHIFILIMLIFSCKREIDKNPLPPNTEIGANTFIFRVNKGEIIYPQVGFLPSGPAIEIFYNHIDPILHNDFHFEIEGRKEYLGINKYVYLRIKKMPSKGNYTLSIDNNDASFADNSNPNNLYFQTDIKNLGILEISKLDTVNHIIVGKFKFEALRYIQFGVTTDEKVIVDGQFDLKYIPNKSTRYY